MVSDSFKKGGALRMNKYFKAAGLILFWVITVPLLLIINLLVITLIFAPKFTFPTAILSLGIAIVETLLLYRWNKAKDRKKDESRKKMSTGVMILGSLNRIFFGYLCLFGWSLIFAMSFSDKWMARLSTELEIKSPIILRAFIIYGIVASAIAMITGSGVLKLRENARTNTLYLGFFTLIFNILFSLNRIFSFEFIGGLFYPCLLIFFFTRPKVKEQFK